MMRLLPYLLLAVALPVCAMAQEARARFGEGPVPFLLRSTTDIKILSSVIQLFAERNPDLTITYEQWGSNALYARARADCDGKGPGADAVLSSAVQQMVSLVNAACSHPHRSALTEALPDSRRWRDELWGITTELAVIAYNKAAFDGDEVPRDRFALLDALREEPGRYRGRIATYDIAASGLGYLFAFSDSLEATTFGALLESYARVEAIATCCSAEIIESVAEGRYLIAYNVLGSYVDGAQEPRVGVVLPEDYTLVLSRAYMIPKGAGQKQAAADLLDFLLSAEAQALLAQAGLVHSLDAAETALAPSARRFIDLSPALLVALDRHRRAVLLRLWSEAFRPADAP